MKTNQFGEISLREEKKDFQTIWSGNGGKSGLTTVTYVTVEKGGYLALDDRPDYPDKIWLSSSDETMIEMPKSHVLERLKIQGEISSVPVIVNMTPHPVHIVDEKNNVIKTSPKSETMIRLSQTTESCGSIDGIPTSRTVFGSATNLPEFSDGIFYIVSQLVKSALADRTDLLVPAEVVRDEAGNIIGCKSLGR